MIAKWLQWRPQSRLHDNAKAHRRSTPAGTPRKNSGRSDGPAALMARPRPGTYLGWIKSDQLRSDQIELGAGVQLPIAAGLWQKLYFNSEDPCSLASSVEILFLRGPMTLK